MSGHEDDARAYLGGGSLVGRDDPSAAREPDPDPSPADLMPGPCSVCGRVWPDWIGRAACGERHLTFQIAQLEARASEIRGRLAEVRRLRRAFDAATGRVDPAKPS